ncbi:MAG: Shikimate 5-dehydrogenase I alpha, partial [uncultured Solirubrobacteraceae bacterium]
GHGAAGGRGSPHLARRVWVADPPLAFAGDAERRARGGRPRRLALHAPSRADRALSGARASAAGPGLRRRQRHDPPQGGGAGDRRRGDRPRRVDRCGEHPDLPARRLHPRRQHRRSGPDRRASRRPCAVRTPRAGARRGRLGARGGPRPGRGRGRRRDLEPDRIARRGARATARGEGRARARTSRDSGQLHFRRSRRGSRIVQGAAPRRRSCECQKLCGGPGLPGRRHAPPHRSARVGSGHGRRPGDPDRPGRGVVSPLDRPDRLARRDAAGISDDHGPL